MDLELGGRTAYVTGGAHGIGRAVADLFVSEGVRVVVSDQDEDALASAAAGWGADAVTIIADLGGEDATRAAREAVAALGAAPDIVVNNVGASASRRFAELSDEDWDAGFRLNLMSHVRASRVLLPAMHTRQGGAVIFLASDLAKQPEAMPVDYAVMKAALVALTKILSLEYTPPIRVNAVCPGPIWTELWTKPGGVVDHLARQYGLSRDEAIQRHIENRHLPLGIGEPADVAAMIAFLASPRAKHITAAAVSVDGGSVRGLF